MKAGFKKKELKMRNFHYETKQEIDINTDEIFLRLRQENLTQEELNDDECLRVIIEDIIEDLGNESNSELMYNYDCFSDIYEWESNIIPQIIKELRGE